MGVGKSITDLFGWTNGKPKQFNLDTSFQGSPGEEQNLDTSFHGTPGYKGPSFLPTVNNSPASVLKSGAATGYSAGQPTSVSPELESKGKKTKLDEALHPAAAAPAAPATAPSPQSQAPQAGGGSESGPGILEQWFNMRSNGTDPAFEYMSDRGHRQINNEFAARGGYNSGAALQGLRDFDANLTSQRMGQLDSLAGGASGEHQGRLNSMFGQANQLAGGQGGISGMYDTSAGNAISAGNTAAIQLALDKAGVDPKTSQGILNALFGLGSAAISAF